MQREFLVADSGDMLEGVLERLQACACHTLPVVRGGELVGLVTMDNIGEFVLIHAALTGKPAPRIPLSAEG
jgi:predicted transcriptional regulator